MFVVVVIVIDAVIAVFAVTVAVIVPYFIENSAHFFTLKMMLKYSLCTIHGR